MARHRAILDTDPDPMERLKSGALLARHWEVVYHELVAQARADGHTWEEIGAVFGISRQAAEKRQRLFARWSSAIFGAY